MESSSREVVFFDGHCQLCDSFVSFILPRSQSLFFSALQSEYALSELGCQHMDSIIFKSKHGRIYYRSAAFIRILSRLGGLWSLTLIFLLVPPFIRDFLYNIIAKNRKKWWSARVSCRVPTVQERIRFIQN